MRDRDFDFIRWMREAFYNKATKGTKNSVARAIDFGSGTIRGYWALAGADDNEVFVAKSKGAIGCNSAQCPAHNLCPSRNDSVGFGERDRLGRSGRRLAGQRNAIARRVFGGTPKTAVGTTALPNAAESFRLSPEPETRKSARFQRTRLDGDREQNELESLLSQLRLKLHCSVVSWARGKRNIGWPGRRV